MSDLRAEESTAAVGAQTLRRLWGSRAAVAVGILSSVSDCRDCGALRFVGPGTDTHADLVRGMQPAWLEPGAAPVIHRGHAYSARLDSFATFEAQPVRFRLVRQDIPHTLARDIEQDFDRGRTNTAYYREDQFPPAALPALERAGTLSGPLKVPLSAISELPAV